MKIDEIDDLSYAQHQEDLFLRHLFAGQSTGFFIDIGASAPVHNSVTYWFYLNGWTGINVDPLAKRISELRTVRPKDFNIEAAVGASMGTRIFYESSGLGGLSSFDARNLFERGKTHRQVEVKVVTLPWLYNAHDVQVVDFIKIDAEGAEQEILETLPTVPVPPRVLIVEAIDPVTKEGNSELWEAGLLNCGYIFIRDDQINRFYARSSENDIIERAATYRHLQRSQYSQMGMPIANPNHPFHQQALRLSKILLKSANEEMFNVVVSSLLRDMPDEFLQSRGLPDRQRPFLVKIYKSVYGHPPNSDALAEMKNWSEGLSAREIVLHLVDQPNFRALFGHTLFPK